MAIEVIRNLGTVKEYSKVSIEVKVIRLNDGSERYDIRKYSDGEHRSRGISLEKDAAKNLYQILKKEFEEDTAKGVSDGPVKTEARSNSQELYNILSEVRRIVAEYNGTKPFYVFKNETLSEMCKELPVTKDELLKIRGVGRSKLEKYGQEFLDVIIRYKKSIEDSI